MTNDGSNTLVYDAENHLLSATNGSASGTYTYDGNNLRVKKVSGSTTTVYIFSGSKLIAEYDNGAAVGSPSREYIYSGAALLAKVDSTGTKYYHQDHLSNRVVTDSSGNTLAQLGHFPFGESWYNATNDKLLFTSYERDAESGNDYAMMRYSVNRLGRFSSPDQLAGNVGDPQSVNRYTYVLNDPCNMTDFFGLTPCKFNIKIANANLLNPDQLKAAEDEINRILGAGNSGLSAVFNSGEPDFTATLKIANNGFWDTLFHGVPDTTYGKNDQVVEGFGSLADSAHIYTNNIQNNLPKADLGLSTGRVIAHEFGHWGLQIYDNLLNPGPQNSGIMARGDKAVTDASQGFFDPKISIPKLQDLCKKRHGQRGGGGGGPLKNEVADPWAEGAWFEMASQSADGPGSGDDVGPGSGWCPTCPPPVLRHRQ